MAAKVKLKKGDKVQVITGKDKGKQGEILRVIREESRVVVQGINQATRHVKPSQLDAGGLRKQELPIHISNVALVDVKTSKPTRVGFKRLNDGKRVRVAKRSGEVLDN